MKIQFKKELIKRFLDVAYTNFIGPSMGHHVLQLKFFSILLKHKIYLDFYQLILLLQLTNY